MVGSGGREDALGWALARAGAQQLWFYPGNAGTLRWGTNISRYGMPAGKSSEKEEVEAIVKWAQAHGIDLVVVGPEAYLAAGLADRMRAAGIPVFGPGVAGARIEASKAWAKEFMARHGIPTAPHVTFTQAEAGAARRYVEQSGRPLVIKADGLAAGKGVRVTASRQEALEALEALLVEGTLGEAGRTVVIEERMEGREVSLLAITDGEALLVLPEAQDHKRVGEGDTGPNTGGMGAYSPVPFFNKEVREQAIRRILLPAVQGLAGEGIDYRGVLYAGLMLTGDGPKVVEFNCRFGDPETQVILPRLSVDWPSLLGAAAQGRLGEYLRELSSTGATACADATAASVANAATAESPAAATGGTVLRARSTFSQVWELRPTTGAALGVVLASRGYPGKYETGFPISGLDVVAALPGIEVFHAGTRVDPSRPGEVLTAGGRVLNVVGLGDTLSEARSRAYEGAAAIRFDNVYYRRDIGHQALEESRDQ